MVEGWDKPWGVPISMRRAEEQFPEGDTAYRITEIGEKPCEDQAMEVYITERFKQERGQQSISFAPI